MAIQTFTGTVLRKKHLTEDVILLSLGIPSDFSFQAGQFENIRIKNNGVVKYKPYSILSPPSQQGQLDLCIKMIENGFASEVFEQTKEGDTFEIKGPFGHFVFDANSPHNEHWFIAAGTGVAPFYSMLQEHLSQSRTKKFILLFGVRSQENLFLHEEFLSLQKKYPHFTYIPTLSRDKWEGKQGRVQNHLPADLQNKTFYICGLKELVLETKELLLRKRVTSADIKFERYS